MQPRIGVYSYDPDIQGVLECMFYGVSNRQLIYHLVAAPLEAIQEELKSVKSNPYILRERHRKWCEYVRETMGTWIDLPDWEEIQDQYSGDCCSGESLHCLCEFLLHDGPEWVLYGDDVDLAYDLVNKLHSPLLFSDDVGEVVRKILEANEGMEDLVVACPELDVIYVVRSPRVEPCADLERDQLDFQAFPNLADCTKAGDIPTYVLEDEVVEELFRIRRIAEEIHLTQQRKEGSVAC